MTYKISFAANPSVHELKTLGDGIMAYASQRRGLKPLEFFAFFMRDENLRIQGGCNGCNLYGCLYIDQLWVAESLRGQGYGSKLLAAAENFGQEKGCTFATVNTMDWEALAFYKKFGYYIEFERRGFLKDSIFYFLRKDLLQ